MDPAAPPMPVRATVAALVNEVELTARLPETMPSTDGVKTIAAVQVAPAARVDGQVFPSRLKGGVAVTTMFKAETGLVFVIVAVWGAPG